MAVWDRYKGKVTSLEVESWTGKAFYIRSFCDDPLGSVYVTKAPVCKLSLTPTTQFENTNIAWDISESDSATGTTDTFTITWGGTTDIGNLSAQSFGVDPESGNVQFTTEGTYTVTAYVVDTLGNRSKECEGEVEIVNDLGTDGANDRLYIGTTDDGLWIRSLSSIANSNSGLSGTDLNFRSVRLHPAYKDLAITKRHLWACTPNGVEYSTDGGATWTNISEATLGTPENEAADGTPPTATDPDNIDLWFDPQDDQRVYLLRTTATRAWLYYTTDYGTTWSSEQVGAI